MTQMKRLARRVEMNFAACQGSYWVGFCAISGFVAVYLSYRGLSNTQIGLTTALGSALAILLQLVLSNVLDNHPELSIKRLISILALVGIGSAACTGFLTMPPLAMIAVFSICYASGQSNGGYLNAMLVQYNNAGVPARYGWPRGVGSFCFAVAAYVLGVLVERYSPQLLMPCSMLGMGVCIVSVLLMPRPEMAGQEKPKEKKRATSYRQMIAGNPELVVLLVCTLINGVGNMAGYTFILRVVERVGGGTVEYGLSEFVRAGCEAPALFASGWLLRRYKARSLLAASFFCYGIRMLMMAFASGMGMLYAASCLNMLCVGLSTFSSVILVNQIVGDTEKVRGQSLNMLCGTIGAIIGSACGGAIIDSFGLTAMLLCCSVFCFAAFAGMALLCRPERQLR